MAVPSKRVHDRSFKMSSIFVPVQGRLDVPQLNLASQPNFQVKFREHFTEATYGEVIRAGSFAAGLDAVGRPADLVVGGGVEVRTP